MSDDALPALTAKWDGVAESLEEIPVAAERVRYAATIKPLLPLARDARILEAGCGSGRLLRALAALGFRNLTGLEISPARLEMVRRMGPPDATLVCSAELPFEPQSFDAIVTSAVIEHVSDPKTWLKQLAQITRPGGIISVATDTYMWKWLKAVGSYRSMQPIDEAIHPRTLIAWGRDAGLQLEACAGFFNTPDQRFYFVQQLIRKVFRTGKFSRWLSRGGSSPAHSLSESESILEALAAFPSNPGIRISECVWSYECFYWFRKC